VPGTTASQIEEIERETVQRPTEVELRILLGYALAVRVAEPTAG